MRHPLRVLALACVLAATPACASLPRFDNPVAAAKTPESQAYGLLATYAAVLEEATDVVRDPATPVSVRRALGQAERVATPAAETLNIAVTAYVRARADYDASSAQGRAGIERAAVALGIAAQRLSEAVSAAQAPIGELERLVRNGK